MKTAYWILGLLCLFVSSCSSKEDEPDLTYKGPWRVVFYEEFIQIHNNTDDFKDWFNRHAKYLSAAQFLVRGDNHDTRWDYPSKEDVEYYYSISYCGAIEWYLEIPSADEDDLKSMVAEFESFTITEDENKKYDKFTAGYMPLKENP